MAEPTTTAAVQAMLLDQGRPTAYGPSRIAAVIGEPTPNGKPLSASAVIAALDADTAYQNSQAPEAIRILRDQAQRLGGLSASYLSEAEGYIVALSDGRCAFTDPFRRNADGRILPPTIGTPTECGTWALQAAFRRAELERRRKVAVAAAAEARKDESNPTRFRYGNGF